ncbi:MAG: UDP-N-acetylmuramoyl-tripeptide--D-alanyl-D-alanine ligase [Myxococcota bacterium]|nr:UDP-N-acetylmuramoyl-tripeptide--D-alanyl-D-alanine ligase [Myxococcota bacterium]
MSETQARLISTFSRAQLARMCGGVLHGSADADAKGVVTGLGSDSRSVGAGDFFVALVGERFDAHDFLGSVADRGAALALVSTLPEPEVLERLPCVLVEDTLVAMQWLARELFEQVLRFHRDVETIALTGSNGKTTTKEILRALWASRGSTYATHGNLNNHIGVPLTLCNLPLSFDSIIVEMGANHVGDIAELIRLAPASRRVITSIGSAHIEGFGGLDGIRRGKGEIFNSPSNGTLAVVPHHERDALIPENFPGRVWTFGPRGSGATLEFSVEGTGVDGMKVWLAARGQELTLTLPLLGAHNASNLAAALATVWDATLERDPKATLDAATLDEALGKLEVPGGRWRKVQVGDLLFLDDAYNANPSSVMASFDAFVQWQAALEESHGGPRVAIIGEMLELGEGAKNFHQEIARSIAKEESLHLLVCVGTYADAMAAAVSERSGLEVVAAKDVASAASALEERTTRGVVFLKASRGARLERVIDIIQDGCPG